MGQNGTKWDRMGQNGTEWKTLNYLKCEISTPCIAPVTWSPAAANLTGSSCNSKPKNNHCHKWSIKLPGAYLSKRVLGAGAYSRMGSDLFNSIQEWGLFFLRHIRANKKYLFILYFRRIIFHVNKVSEMNYLKILFHWDVTPGNIAKCYNIREIWGWPEDASGFFEADISEFLGGSFGTIC